MMNDFQKKGITVMVVEDYKFTQDFIVAILEREGYIVVGRANNGKKALELYKDLEPDIVTMDMNMPGMNGLQTIQAMVAMDPDAKIVAITGYRDIEKKTRELGARGFLAKPFNPKQLFEAIEEVLNSSVTYDDSDWSQPSTFTEDFEPVHEETIEPVISEVIDDTVNEDSTDTLPEPWSPVNEIPDFTPVGEVIIISSDDDEEDDLLSSPSARKSHTNLVSPIISSDTNSSLSEEYAKEDTKIPETETYIEPSHDPWAVTEIEEDIEEETVEAIEPEEEIYQELDDEDFIQILNKPLSYPVSNHKEPEPVIPEDIDSGVFQVKSSDEPLIIKPPKKREEPKQVLEAGTSEMDLGTEKKKKKFFLFRLFSKDNSSKKKEKKKNKKGKE